MAEHKHTHVNVYLEKCRRMHSECYCWLFRMSGIELESGSLGWEDPLQKETASHSSIQPTLSMENPMDSGAWWATIHGVAKRHVFFFKR